MYRCVSVIAVPLCPVFTSWLVPTVTVMAYVIVFILLYLHRVPPKRGKFWELFGQGNSGEFRWWWGKKFYVDFTEAKDCGWQWHRL